MASTLTMPGTGNCIGRKPFNGFELKLFAMVTMTIDHTAAILGCGSFYSNMRMIGRLAFPVYCFLLVEGFFHTHDPLNYFGRLFLVALVSDVPFDLAFGGGWPSWSHQNVLFTLLLGFIGIWLLENHDRLANYITKSPQLRNAVETLILMGAVLGTMFLGNVCHTDYGGGGVLLILLFYTFREHWIGLVISIPIVMYLFFGTIELPGALALIPILLYNGKRGPEPGGKAGQWFLYFYYPLHILVLYLIYRSIPHTVLELPIF